VDLNRLHTGDALKWLKTLPDNSVHCTVTSPPYWMLRDYGVKGQLGLEKTPEELIRKLVLVFREVRRVLRPDGTCWVNMGDSYAGNGAAYSSEKSTLHGRKQGLEMGVKRQKKSGKGLKPKDLVGIPWMLAFALRADGWYLRQDIIWSKPNPMPESVMDRCTKGHEYIFMLTKSKKYYYDAAAIKTPYSQKTLTTFGSEVKGYGDGTGLIASENWANSITIRQPKKWLSPSGWDTGEGAHGSIHPTGREGIEKTDKQRGHSKKHAGFNDRWDQMTAAEQMSMGANKRSVWTIATRPFKDAHFATFPAELARTCIMAGCPINGIVMDPFAGANTAGIEARKLGRNYIGCELNPKYVKIAIKREKNELGLFY
jgi:DNA modification methylase